MIVVVAARRPSGSWGATGSRRCVLRYLTYEAVQTSHPGLWNAGMMSLFANGGAQVSFAKLSAGTHLIPHTGAWQQRGDGGCVATQRPVSKRCPG